jgi:hypothetical protein
MSGQGADKTLVLHLLTESDLTLREIAKRVGCSAERARQLSLKLLGRTGHQAQRERRKRKLQESFERNEFVKAAKRRGCNVEPSKRTPLHWYKRELYVNGKFCLLRRAYKNVARKGWYTAIRKPEQREEICVLKLGKGRFLIIPMKNMPRSATMFSLGDADSSKRVYKLRYYWREYFNNWAAFKQKKDRGSGRQRVRGFH